MNPIAINPAFHLALGLGVLLAFGLLAARPRDRRAIRHLLLILLALAALHWLGVALADRPLGRAGQLLTHAADAGLGVVLIRLGGFWLFDKLLPLLRLQPARIVEDLLVTGVAAGWLLYWLHGVGLDLASLLTTSAVITAVLAFSMQDTLGNVLGGVVLQLDDSLRVGDWVKIDDISGQVVDVRWRYTAVETRNRETVIIPNGWLVKNRFAVIGSRHETRLRWRRWLWFNIDPQASPARVCRALEDAVTGAAIDNVMHDPAPTAVLMEVAFGYSRYALRYWLEDPRPDDPTDSAVRQHALAALARHGIRLAVPKEERLLVSNDLQHLQAMQEDEIERRRRALAEVELFAALDRDELDALARRLVPAPFVAGDVITRQGAVAHWLYLIHAGEADVWHESSAGRHHVATLQPGSVFGEMGMMTGEPRSATVTARGDVECLRVDKAAFESILHARPDIAEAISRVMLKRRGELDSHRGDGEGATNAAPQDALLSRIRAFFGLAATP